MQQFITLTEINAIDPVKRTRETTRVNILRGDYGSYQKIGRSYVLDRAVVMARLNARGAQT